VLPVLLHPTTSGIAGGIGWFDRPEAAAVGGVAVDYAGAPLPPAFVNKPPVPSWTYTFFLSSGDDVRPQRDEFDLLAQEVSHQYREARYGGGRLWLEVDRWEKDAARRFDGPPNAEFVRRAVDAHCTVVLLSTAVRRGTQEEIEGVLAVGLGTQLCVIRMVPDGRAGLDDSQLQQFLKDHQNDFLYKETGPPGSANATRAMVGIIARLLADVTNPSSGRRLFYENR
jgi:hypothetical protein